MWIWYQCQNRIGKHYHHNGEQLGCYKKVHAKTQTESKKKDVTVILVLQKQRIPIYLTKTVVNTTSNAILNMNKGDLDQS